jgi:hypothetical protein
VRYLTGSVLVLLVLACACRRHPTIELSEIAATDTAGWAHDIVLEKDTLYLSDRQGGFLMFQRAPDWSRPRVFHPVTDVISLAPNSGMPVLASRFEGLVLVSADGRVLARYANGDIANAVVTRGDFAFAAYGLHGLVVAKLARDSIHALAELSSPGWSHDVKLSREQAFVADWNYGLRVVDIHDPAHPAETAVLSSPATTIAVSIRESGGNRVAAIADGRAGVALADLDASGHPHLLGRNRLGLNSTDQPHPESGGWAHSVAWSGRHLFVANWKCGLTVLDVADLSNPRVIREIPTNGTALGVKTEEQPDGSWLVFLADGEAGLKVYRFKE